MDIRTFEINGHNFKVIRSVINVFRGECTDVFYRLSELDISLSVLERDQLIRTLHEQGYLEKSSDDIKDTGGFYSYPYNLVSSEEGVRLACKPLAKRKTKKVIDKKVQALLSRADEMTKLPFLKYEVGKIAVFGSYLNEDNVDFGDLDFVCTLSKKSDYEKSNNMPTNTHSDVLARVAKGKSMKADGLLDYRPLSYGSRMCWYLSWDFKAAKYHLIRKDPILSMCDIDVMQQLKGVDDCLVVFDAEKGGVCTPYKLHKSKI